jgi:hypothetical protein
MRRSKLNRLGDQFHNVDGPIMLDSMGIATYLLLGRVYRKRYRSCQEWEKLQLQTKPHPNLHLYEPLSNEHCQAMET